MTITIRHAAPSDLASIQAISDAAYGVYVAMGQKPGPMLADYGAHLADDAVLVAADMRGYAVMLDRPDGFWLENIAVDPAAQGQGIGSSLIDAVEDWFRGRTDHYRLSMSK